MDNKKKAFVTGAAGQDGSYLVELLLSKGYVVHGMTRRNSVAALAGENNYEALLSMQSAKDGVLFLHEMDLLDPGEIGELISELNPDEVYHLAGHSSVSDSNENPLEKCELSGVATLRLLECVSRLRKRPRFFHSSSSEIFGEPEVTPQNENTPHLPSNHYGCYKSFATNIVRVYREKFGLYAVNGILFNHESPRRGVQFVTKKIARSVAAIKSGGQHKLSLGDLKCRRDWGYAPDYVYGMWLSLQAKTPDDYIFATGVSHSVEDVVKIAFDFVGLNWKHYVDSNISLVRLDDYRGLVGDPTKAIRLLGWRATKSFKGTIQDMVRFELERTS